MRRPIGVILMIATLLHKLVPATLLEIVIDCLQKVGQTTQTEDTPQRP